MGIREAVAILRATRAQIGAVTLTATWPTPDGEVEVVVDASGMTIRVDGEEVSRVAA